MEQFLKMTLRQWPLVRSPHLMLIIVFSCGNNSRAHVSLQGLGGMLF